MRALASRDVLGAPLRRLHQALGGTCVILTYHRITEAGPDPQMLGITPERFSAHIETIARDFTPMSTATLVEHLRSRTRFPTRAVVVTFDDGYANNLGEALPVLRAHGVPATVFVTSALVGSSRLTWVDELEDLILRATALPPQLSITGPDGTHTYDLAAEADLPTDPAWDITMPSTGPRTAVYRAAVDRLLGFAPAARETALDEIRTQTELHPLADERRRMLAAHELAELAADDLVTIGCHTAHHPRLAALPKAAQREQITAARSALETATGQAVTLFAYPYGGRNDYSDDSVVQVRRAGFEAAFTTRYGAASPYSDRWHLPRVSVNDRNSGDLAAALAAAVRSGK